MIYMDSHSTIPNEASGNQFTNLQIQPSSKTKSILTVSGQHNEFHGMLWDLNQINHGNTIVELTDKVWIRPLIFLLCLRAESLIEDKKIK